MDVFLENINCQNWSEKKENLNKPFNMKELQNYQLKFQKLKKLEKNWDMKILHNFFYTELIKIVQQLAKEENR